MWCGLRWLHYIILLDTTYHAPKWTNQGSCKTNFRERSLLFIDGFFHPHLLVYLPLAITSYSTNYLDSAY